MAQSRISAGPTTLGLGKPLKRAFFGRSVHEVAPDLIGATLLVNGVGGIIVEVEAYHHTEPAAHSYRGPTPRNAVMFGPPGGLYVYRSYGLHWCANAVCGPEGVGHAVLIRALAPIAGVADMRLARAHGQIHLLADRDLCRGPGRLCQALGITLDHNGADLVSGDGGVIIVDDGCPALAAPGVSRRVGLTQGAEHPWRFYVPGDRHVS